jgi:O-antigen ligase
LLFLGLSFAGGLPILGAFSHYALHACYATIAVCAAACAVLEPRAVGRVACLAPYLLWVTFYIAWGTLAAWYPGQVLPDAERVLLRNVVLAGGFAMVVGNLRDLGAVARLFRVAVLVNCALAVYESLNPRLIEDIARFLNPQATAFSVLRPAGLWSNPNEAAFAFLFSLLLSHWDRGLGAWAGRVASLAGIYLTVSRTGLYVALLCGLLYGLSRWRALIGDLRRTVISLNATWAAGLAIVLLVLVLPVRFDISDSYNLQRVLDFSENSTRGAGAATRAELAAQAFDAALERPLVGYGLFAFQDVGTAEHGEAATSDGAHNIYVTVFGEGGLLALSGYLAVLGLGVARLFAVRARREDRFIGILLWTSYLIIGFAWHNQVTSMSGVIYVAILYSIPGLIALPARAPGGPPAPSRIGAENARTRSAV